MNEYKTLCHSKWDCKYHVVFIQKVPTEGAVRGAPEEVSGRGVPEARSRRRAEWGGGAFLLPDQVHMLVSIPPKYAVAQVIGFIKGKCAIHIARTFGE